MLVLVMWELELKRHVMQGKQQDELIVKLLEDEKYQREAFQSLLLQQDHRSQVRLLFTPSTTAIKSGPSLTG
jgi:hypothetical protein